MLLLDRSNFGGCAISALFPLFFSWLSLPGVQAILAFFNIPHVLFSDGNKFSSDLRKWRSGRRRRRAPSIGIRGRFIVA
ncbi:unnamed protein product [Coffea canephora]|uniref:Uncharacterized protein n=1 Tax=Coffea canephora TaxID=49390 RepID=A0A068TNR9_COFCA|nr:unnamed protein product [Coffea canephora]